MNTDEKMRKLFVKNLVRNSITVLIFINLYLLSLSSTMNNVFTHFYGKMEIFLTARNKELSYLSYEPLNLFISFAQAISINVQFLLFY